MTTSYTEMDTLLREQTIDEIAFQTASMGMSDFIDDAAVRLLLAKTQDGKVHGLHNGRVSAWFDHELGMYFLVVRDFYHPENLVAVLFDHIILGTSGDDKHAMVDQLIGRYLGRIESKENVSLTEEKNRLTALAASLKDTVSTLGDDDYTEAELERLLESLDRAFYEPMTEILEMVLVKIAGNKS